MDKNTSKCLKGIAILFMLWLHLFMGQEVFINGKVIIYDGIPYTIIRRCVNPVAFYLILGGYGLYLLNHRRNFEYDFHKRVAKLYIHYWLSLLFFLPLGALIVGTAKYPGDFVSFINNITCWKLSYNHALWFMMPYAVLTLASPLIVKLADKFPKTFLSSVTLIWLICSYITSKIHHPLLEEGHIPYMLNVTLRFLFPFSVGILLAKYKIIEKIHLSIYIVLPLLLILVFVRALISTSMVHCMYATLFIILFASMDRPKVLDKLLAEFGKRSTSMWFIHCYFCYYYFTQYIYMLKNPILMFVILVAVTYISAIILDFVNNKIQFLLKSK